MSPGYRRGARGGPDHSRRTTHRAVWHHVLATALVCSPGPDCQGCAAAAAPRRTDPGRHRRRTRGRHRHHAR